VNCQTLNIYIALHVKSVYFNTLESERSLKERLSEHKGYVVNNMMSKATGEHFYKKGHKVSDMQVTIIE